MFSKSSFSKSATMKNTPTLVDQAVDLHQEHQEDGDEQEEVDDFMDIGKAGDDEDARMQMIRARPTGMFLR